VIKTSILGKSLLLSVAWMDVSIQGQVNSVSVFNVLLLVHLLDL